MTAPTVLNDGANVESISNMVLGYTTANTETSAIYGGLTGTSAEPVAGDLCVVLVQNGNSGITCTIGGTSGITADGAIDDGTRYVYLFSKVLTAGDITTSGSYKRVTVTPSAHSVGTIRRIGCFIIRHANGWPSSPRHLSVGSITGTSDTVITSGSRTRAIFGVVGLTRASAPSSDITWTWGGTTSATYDYPTSASAGNLGRATWDTASGTVSVTANNVGAANRVALFGVYEVAAPPMVTGTGKGTIAMTASAASQVQKVGSGKATIAMKASGSGFLLGETYQRSPGTAAIVLTGSGSATTYRIPLRSPGTAKIALTGYATAEHKVHGTGKASIVLTGVGDAVLHQHSAATAKIAMKATGQAVTYQVTSAQAHIALTATGTGTIPGKVNSGGYAHIALKATGSAQRIAGTTGKAGVVLWPVGLGGVIRRSSAKALIAVKAIGTGSIRPPSQASIPARFTRTSTMVHTGTTATLKPGTSATME